MFSLVIFFCSVFHVKRRRAVSERVICYRYYAVHVIPTPCYPLQPLPISENDDEHAPKFAYKWVVHDEKKSFDFTAEKVNM